MMNPNKTNKLITALLICFGFLLGRASVPSHAFALPTESEPLVSIANSLKEISTTLKKLEEKTKK